MHRAWHSSPQRALLEEQTVNKNQMVSVKETRRALVRLRDEFKRIKGKKGEIYSMHREKLYIELHNIYLGDRLTMESVAKNVNLSVGLVSQKFKEYGLESRSCGERVSGIPYRRTWSVREEAFDKIEDDESAYWAGFLWADGRVMMKNDRPEGVRVVLHPRDKDHLVVLAGFLGSDKKINEIITTLNCREHPQVELSVYSTKLGAALWDAGFRPHRSVDDGPMPSIDPALYGAFFRGLFDGDGHIQHAQSDGFFLSGWDVGLCGSAKIVAAFVDFLEKANGIKMYDVVKNGRSLTNLRVNLSGPRVFRMLEVLYPEGCFALDRKLKLAEILIHYRRKAQVYGVKEVQRGDGRRFVETDLAQAMLAKQFFLEVKNHYVRKKRKQKKVS